MHFLSKVLRDGGPSVSAKNQDKEDGTAGIDDLPIVDANEYDLLCEQRADGCWVPSDAVAFLDAKPKLLRVQTEGRKRVKVFLMAALRAKVNFRCSLWNDSLAFGSPVSLRRR